MIWQWLRGSRPWTWGLLGAIVLFLYGVIPTFQTAFGRVYAAYGGFVIVLSLLWGWVLDGNKPNHLDLIGGAMSLVGVTIMIYWPR
jgi:small multidrug resistance family-3 protein